MSDRETANARALRLRAEAHLQTARDTDGPGQGGNNEQLGAEATERAIHELRVHQVELELQNEELRQTQLELDASQARWIDLYDTAPTGYCTVDESGLIVLANLTLSSLLRVTRDAIVGQPLTNFIMKEHQDTYYLLRNEVVTDGTPVSSELQMRRGDETPFWAQLTVTATLDTHSRPERRIVIGDITARKQAEEESSRLHAQLQQAEKLESVGRLAGGVAHDYNNTLSVILGRIELALQDQTISQSMKEHLTEVQTAARRSGDFMKQLLSFARRQVVSPQVLNLNSAVARSLMMLRRLIGEQIRFSWEPTKELWLVTMDPLQLDQILTNLCLNARDAIGGVGTIAISSTNRSDVIPPKTAAGAPPGDYAQLTVSDDGCGISEDLLKRIFEPFYTSKDVGKGTGLGLSSVHGAVQQNGGFINVSSVLGEGTQFEIFLPRCLDDNRAQVVLEPKTTNSRGHETILVVEDEPALLKLIARSLTGQGYTVLAAGGPQEALRLAEQHSSSIALVLSDLRMPEMNGYELAAQLRSAHNLSIHLFMSGYPADRAEVDEPGFFIAKPFSLTKLARRVRHVLEASDQ